MLRGTLLLRDNISVSYSWKVDACVCVNEREREREMLNLYFGTNAQQEKQSEYSKYYQQQFLLGIESWLLNLEVFLREKI